MPLFASLDYASWLSVNVNSNKPEENLACSLIVASSSSLSSLWWVREEIK